MATNNPRIYTERLGLMIDPETKAQVVALARKRRVTLSELVRDLVRREAEAAGVEARFRELAAKCRDVTT